MTYWDDDYMYDNHYLDYERERHGYSGYDDSEDGDRYSDSEIMEQFDDMLYMLDVKPDESDFYVPAVEHYQDIVDTYNALGRYWYRNSHRDYSREYPDGRTPEEYIEDLYDTAKHFAAFIDDTIYYAPELSEEFNFQHILDITKELVDEIKQKYYN